MLYIIPIKAESIKDTIQVEDELGVAEFFLTKDSAATITQKILSAVFSDFILNFLFSFVNVSPRELYLRHIYNELKDGMYSEFIWGDEGLVKYYFS